MQAKLLVLLLCLSAVQVCFAETEEPVPVIIKLEEVEAFESIEQLKFKDKIQINRELRDFALPSKPELGTFCFGALKTNIALDPFKRQASISAELDLIDCYYLIKSKPDPRSFITYAVKNIKRDARKQYDWFEELKQQIFD